MKQSSVAKRDQKTTLKVVDMGGKLQERKTAEVTKQELEITRLDSLVNALKERCYLLEQCLVQERKDSHRLRQELTQAKRQNVSALGEHEMRVETAYLKDLVHQQADLIEKLHSENCAHEEQIVQLKETNETLFVANERMKQSNITLRRNLNAAKKR